MRILTTSTPSEIGARLTFRVNAHIDANRRGRFWMRRALVLNDLPAWEEPGPNTLSKE
jgi:hypothetical protein